MSEDHHRLNGLLAQWAGVEVEEATVPGEIDQGFKDLRYWVNYADGEEVWDPLTDANQLELVKAGLRKDSRKLGYSMFWDGVIHHVTLYKIGTIGDPLGFGIDVSEALALAKAIELMEGR